jgi:tetratricopeptide (TPR) repeat protein
MFDEALREFRRVLDLHADDGSARFYIGLVLLRQGKWADAAAACQDAANRPGVRPAVLHNLAFALERQGDYSGALRALHEASRRSGGTDARIQTSLGIVSLLAGDLPAAADALKAARPLWGSKAPSPAWYHYAALSAALLGDLALAQSVLEEGVGAHPRSAALLNNLAVVFERRNQADQAFAVLERALAEDSGLPQVQKNLGDAHYRAGRYDDALEAYQRAVKTNPDLGDDVYLKLGNIRFRLQDRDEAIRCWEHALAINPANAIVRTNLDAVRQVL